MVRVIPLGLLHFSQYLMYILHTLIQIKLCPKSTTHCNPQLSFPITDTIMTVSVQHITINPAQLPGDDRL